MHKCTCFLLLFSNFACFRKDADRFILLRHGRSSNSKMLKCHLKCYNELLPRQVKGQPCWQRKKEPFKLIISNKGRFKYWAVFKPHKLYAIILVGVRCKRQTSFVLPDHHVRWLPCRTPDCFGLRKRLFHSRFHVSALCVGVFAGFVPASPHERNAKLVASSPAACLTDGK